MSGPFNGRSKWRRRTLTGVVFLVLVIVLWLVFQLPWITQWGSTSAERAMPMSGDEIVTAVPEASEGLLTPYHAATYTRSLTVNAPPERIWPWLVQMGQDKGGFYTSDWAERLFGDPVHNATRIEPRWQDLEAGDEVHPFPTGTPWIAATVEPNRVLVLKLEDHSWSWATELKPAPGGRTRVITRFKSAPRTIAGKVASNVFLGPADLIVFPRVLYGLKQRAEGTLPGFPGTSVGAPLPVARLPVHWGSALVWLTGTAAIVLLMGRRLGMGRIGEPRPHPGMTLFAAFLAGSGYMILSDTPPGEFLATRWAFGLPLGLILGCALGVLLKPVRQPVSLGRRAARALVSLAETGVMVVLPATAVWHAATALGWTDAPLGAALSGFAAVAVAAAVGVLAAKASELPVVQTAVGRGGMAAGFVITGSGLVPLLGAAVAELAAGSGLASRFARLRLRDGRKLDSVS